MVNLGPGANMQGDGGKHKYDIDVQIGTEAIGKDDIGETTFIVKGITFAQIDFSLEFGVRVTKVGIPTNSLDVRPLVLDMDPFVASQDETALCA